MNGLRRMMVVVWVFAGCVCACADTRRLDEAVFHDGPRYTLKVVRYYRRLFLHYEGETFSVQCASAGTATWDGHDTQDPGWRMLATGGAIGSKNAREIAGRVKDDYVIVNESTLAIKGVGFRVSFDACASFVMWDPTTLGAELIEPVEKPSYCAPRGTGDCRYYDFQGDRQPQFDQIRVDSENGTISFLARSKSFKHVHGLRVESGDFGKTWSVTPVTREAGSNLPASEGRNACKVAVEILARVTNAETDPPEVRSDGCRVVVSAPRSDSSEGALPDQVLRSELQKAGWVEETRLAADGPDGTAFGLHRGPVLCLFEASWAYDEARRKSGGPYRLTIQCTESSMPGESSTTRHGSIDRRDALDGTERGAPRDQRGGTSPTSSARVG